MFDPMSELSDDEPKEEASSAPAGKAPAGKGDRKFADELHSVTIHAKQRTFYIDLKESANGKFFKISEKSRGGQKTTIMFDAEDLEQFIKAFEEMKSHI